MVQLKRTFSTAVKSAVWISLDGSNLVMVTSRLNGMDGVIYEENSAGWAWNCWNLRLDRNI